jgi:phosphate-selective porin OprO/OprP
LTGERAASGGVKPRAVFDPAQGAWGAWQVAARVSRLDIDSDAFTRYADPAKSARSARAWTGGLTWYLNASVKVLVDTTTTTFDGGAASGADRPTERDLFTRVQFAF